MDTSKVYLIQDAKSIEIQDSLVSHLEQLTFHYINKPHNFDYSILIPLASAILGGILAITGQWVIKSIDRRSERVNSKIEIKSYISMLMCQLSFELKDLAYFKQNTELQLLYHRLENDPAKKTKYYEEHYKSNSNIWECDKSISNTISSIGAHIVKYQMKSKIAIDIQNLITNIQEMNFETAKDYSHLSIIPDENTIKLDIDELHLKYISKFTIINSIINKVLQDK